MGTRYLSLGVLGHVFGVRYGLVYSSIGQQVYACSYHFCFPEATLTKGSSNSVATSGQTDEKPSIQCSSSQEGELIGEELSSPPALATPHGAVTSPPVAQGSLPPHGSNLLVAPQSLSLSAASQEEPPSSSAMWIPPDSSVHTQATYPHYPLSM